MSEANLNNIEQIKHRIDLVKHITTLSTGSIVLLATFLEKLFPEPQNIRLIPVSFGGFIFSIIAAIITHGFLTDLFTKKPGTKDFNNYYRYVLIGLGVTWVAFLVGLIALSFFAVENFLA